MAQPPTQSARLVHIADQCKDGCQAQNLTSEIHIMALRVEQQRRELERIVKLVKALRKGVQSKSEERRFAKLIEAAAEAGLK
jgi:hypothetical protein